MKRNWSVAILSAVALLLLAAGAVILVQRQAIEAAPGVTLMPGKAEETPEVLTVSFTKLQESVAAGESFDLEYEVSPTGARDANVTLSSSDESIATVDQQGSVTGIHKGTATIKATLDSDAAVCTSFELIVEPAALMGIHLDTRFFAMSPGMSQTVRVRPVPEAAETTPSWSSSDEKIVTVDETGKLTANSVGTAKITVKAENGSEALCFVTVAKRLPAEPLGKIETPRYIQNDEGVYENKEQSETGEATLMLVGDLMALPSQQRTAYKNGVMNFNNSFSLIRKVFANADFVIGNLETAVAASSPYTMNQTQSGGNPHCNAPATYLDAVRYAGFDAVVTANNHCCDAGFAGIYETLGMTEKYGLAHTGTFADENEARYLLVKINGIKVAILSYSELFNGKTGKIPASDRDFVINPYSREKMEQDVAAAKHAGAEFIIAYNHWGKENTRSLTRSQTQHAQEMADAGVDLIAGSHPHCIQRADIIEAKDGRQVFCIYSLGNFVASMPRAINHDTMLLCVKLKRADSGKVELVDQGYISAFVQRGDDGAAFCVTPTSPKLNGGLTSSALSAAQKRNAKAIDDQLKEITKL